jgi:hypothetical protein
MRFLADKLQDLANDSRIPRYRICDSFVASLRPFHKGPSARIPGAVTRSETSLRCSECPKQERAILLRLALVKLQVSRTAREASIIIPIWREEENILHKRIPVGYSYQNDIFSNIHLATLFKEDTLRGIVRAGVKQNTIM